MQPLVHHQVQGEPTGDTYLPRGAHPASSKPERNPEHHKVASWGEHGSYGFGPLSLFVLKAHFPTLRSKCPRKPNES